MQQILGRFLRVILKKSSQSKMTVCVLSDDLEAPKKVIVENPSSPQSKQNDKELVDYAETMRLLRQRIDEPFVTVNTVIGYIRIKQVQEEYDKLIGNNTRKLLMTILLFIFWLVCTICVEQRKTLYRLI